MAQIPLSEFEGYWKDVADWSTSRSNSKPLIQKFSRQSSVLTTTPITASSPYTSSTFDTLALPQMNMVTAHCFSDQDGTLYMDVSMDGTNWNLVQCFVSINANTAGTIGWQQPLDRYFRFRFVTTVDQTIFRLSMTSYN